MSDPATPRSTDDSFGTAEEFYTPTSHILSGFNGNSPGTPQSDAPIESNNSLEDEAPSHTPPTEQNTIPPPPTHSTDGQPLQWDTFDAGFQYLLKFAKEHNFCVKKGRSKMRYGRRTHHWINCVKGGQRNFTKVSTPDRKRQSASLISDEPCPFKACLRALHEGDLITLDLPDSTHNHGPASAWSAFDRHRREARRSSANLLTSIRTDFDGNIEATRSCHSI
jgi:hypothetical protein